MEKSMRGSMQSPKLSKKSINSGSLKNVQKSQDVKMRGSRTSNKDPMRNSMG